MEAGICFAWKYIPLIVTYGTLLIYWLSILICRAIVRVHIYLFA